MEVEKTLGCMLMDRHLTVGTAESCTGGSIAARLTSVAGSSAYVKGGIVAYTVAVKEEVLGVPCSVIEQYGVVSKETAQSMAQNAMKTLKTDCALATTGVAGPGGGTPTIPVGSIWIAAAYRDKVATMLQTSDNGRHKNVEKAVENALYMLIELLKNS